MNLKPFIINGFGGYLLRKHIIKQLKLKTKIVSNASEI